ncbi:hypothetical protein PAXRUDRAFT_828747 [Paxillus rubicundulus Ve08.2h10]|uniref:Uncharacterized protein n=1 Tax=Paxillus rubicundulus Ve08.2h10 TaxID=930991 RepID=A0A0D0DVP4_9AGAM|nr:hypothetical protein PAXRUDRAFT_828747 [Paxillus rubicundulus Ve08.2h10]
MTSSPAVSAIARRSGILSMQITRKIRLILAQRTTHWPAGPTPQTPSVSFLYASVQ